MHDICAVLSLVTRRAFLPFYRIDHVHSVCHDTLPISHEHLDRYNPLSATTAPFSPTPAVLTDSDVDTEELASLVSAYSTATDELRRLLHLPVGRLRSSMSRVLHDDRCIELWIAIEAFFRSQKKEEIAKRAAWACSVFGGTADAKRRIEKFYDQRTRVLHCRPYELRSELAVSAEDVLITCLKWVISEQRMPDWGTEVKRKPMGPA